MRGNINKPKSVLRLAKAASNLPFACLIILLCGSIALSQTSIVAIRTPDEIVVASDSLVTTTRDGQPHSEPFCKIIRLADGMYFAASGLIKIGQSPYDLFKAVRMARLNAEILADGSFEWTSDLITTDVAAILGITLTDMEKTRPNIRQELAKEDLFRYVLFGSAKGQLVLRAKTFRLLPSEQIINGVSHRTFAVESMEYNCPGQCPNGSAVIRLGRVEAINNLLKARPLPWNMTVTDMARFMVTLEIVDEPKFVGPPVQIVRITKDGRVEWIQREKKCEADTEPPYNPPFKCTLR